MINAIGKEDRDRNELKNPSYPEHLWREKKIKRVANAASRDIAEFLELAAQTGIKPEYQEYGPEQANQALMELKQRKIRGAKVLRLA